MNYLKNLVEDIKAWRRKEVRVAPRGATGRVYARKDGESASPGRHASRAEPLVSLEMVITRADGTKETVRVPGVATHG